MLFEKAPSLTGLKYGEFGICDTLESDNPVEFPLGTFRKQLLLSMDLAS